MTTIPPETAVGPTRDKYAKPLIIALLGGCAVALAIGVYARVHHPSGFSLDIAGFSSPLYAKAWLTTFAVVFAIGGGLAGLAGALAAPVRSLSPGMGFSILIESFIVTVIGGMGSITGALVSALLIGMVRGFGTIGFPKFTDGLIYILMIAILLLRPQGLFGRRA